MNTPGDVSPPLGPTQLAGGHAPPTPPHESALDDIYGSAPSSPSGAADEMLSDLPSRQRAHDADAYREGLSGAKGTYVQQGFDEGYALGASLGARAGYVMGVLRGFVDAWRGRDAQAHGEAVEVLERARAELAIGELLGEKWVDGEGVWKWRGRGIGARGGGTASCHEGVGRESEAVGRVVGGGSEGSRDEFGRRGSRVKETSQSRHGRATVGYQQQPR
jgi:hypothetical protein